jgi:hypothetical protein
VQQDAQKDQHEKYDDFHRPGSPTLRTIEGSEDRQQEQECDVDPHFDPANSRNFKRPSHVSNYDASSRCANKTYPFIAKSQSSSFLASVLARDGGGSLRGERVERRKQLGEVPSY